MNPYNYNNNMCKNPCNNHRPGPGTPPPCQPPRRPEPPCEKSSMSKEQLLCLINEVSFAKDDMLLYLNTHPHDKNALEYIQEQVKIRNKALKEYAQRFGPLTIDTTNDTASDSWEWVMTPWPWECKGGKC